MDKVEAVTASDGSAGATVEKKKAKAKLTCFTIMPFGEWFDDYYEDLYCPAICAAGLEPKRADDLYRPSTIINDIWAYTQTAKLILADLTGKNPNVFYELGLAHALAKPAILITESINDVPFDLRSLRVIVYDKNQPDWGVALQDGITKSIKEIIESPLESVLPTFLTVKPGARTKEVTVKDKTILEMKRDIDLLRMELRRGGPMGHNIVSSSEEAEMLFRRFVDVGLPPNLIEQNLRERGVPGGWIKNRLMSVIGSRRHRASAKPRIRKGRLTRR
jgi:hypothetical protein